MDAKIIAVPSDGDGDRDGGSDGDGDRDRSPTSPEVMFNANPRSSSRCDYYEL